MNASRDENNITTLTGTLNTDGATVIKVGANPTNHALDVADGVTGTDYGTDVAIRDENFVPVLLAVSSADGETPVPVYVDANGFLLVDSN